MKQKNLSQTTKSVDNLPRRNSEVGVSIRADQRRAKAGLPFPARLALLWILLSNARQFYSSMANPLGRKGLSTSVKLLKWVETNSVLNPPQVIFHLRNIFVHESPLIKSNSIFICPNQIKRWLYWCWIPCTGTTSSTPIPLWTRLQKISLCGLKNSWYSPKDAREKYW